MARAALAQTYGQKGVGSGPTYKGMTADGDKVTLAFENVGTGLMAKYATLNGF